MDPLPRVAVKAPTAMDSLQAGAQAVMAAAVPMQRQARHDAHQATQGTGMAGGPMRKLTTSLQPLGDRARQDKDPRFLPLRENVFLVSEAHAHEFVVYAKANASSGIEWSSSKCE